MSNRDYREKKRWERHLNILLSVSLVALVISLAYLLK